MQPPFEFEDNRYDYPPAARPIRPAFAKCVESVTFFGIRERALVKKPQRQPPPQTEELRHRRDGESQRRQPKNSRNENNPQQPATAVAGC